MRRWVSLKKIRELLKLSISKDLLNRVYFCCVDLNPIALNEAKSILGKKYFFIEGDISDPYSIKSELDYIFGKSKKLISSYENILRS